MSEKKPFLYTLFFAAASLAAIFIILSLAFSFKSLIEKRKNSSSLPASTNSARMTIVIDAGHGGEDGGAVADDGTLEKDLNLQISKLLCALYELNGIPVRMTRDTDTMLYDHYGELEDYKGQKKLYDLKNRIKITEEYENPVYIGIHMNKFPQKKYSGLTVYYSKNNQDSYLLAASVHDFNKTYLQPGNKREIKCADSSIFILDNIKCPSVLVECGFVSNDKELALLKDEKYQCKLALVLFSSSMAFYS